MLKKSTAFFVAAMMILLLCFPVQADDVIELRTADDLFLLQSEPYGEYRLAEDIDMSTFDWSPAPFFGTLDGDGHTLYNLRITSPGEESARTVDGNNLEYDTLFAALFSRLGGTVRELSLRGVDIAVESAENCYVASVAGALEDGVIENCTVEDARLSLTCTNEEGRWGVEKYSCMAGIGGLAGFGKGSIRNCRADVTLSFTDESLSWILCEQFMGGILANGNAEISDCAVTVRGYDACRGYAHNGGLVGMFFSYDHSAPQRITNCAADGFIRFFEQNSDRRAYCAPYVGELLTWTEISGCTESFTRDEIFDYNASLSPESCAEPALNDEITPPTCSEWGYITHRCENCGNTWRDSFTPSAHTAGEWIVTRAPAYGINGQETLSCSVCGALLEERELPALVPTASVALSEQELALHYKESRALRAAVLPENAEKAELIWSSSDESVVTVDGNGNAKAVGRGKAMILCASADGFASAECAVSVKYSPVQWLIKILLFGWIWY